MRIDGNTLVGTLYPNDELTHWGVKGMKWGVRRYQNRDGSLTTKGRDRYGSDRKGYVFDKSYNSPYDNYGYRIDNSSIKDLTKHTVRAGRDYVQSLQEYDGSIFNLDFDSIQSTMPSIDLFDYKD